MKGLSFPEYDGPLVDVLARACFVCGQEPDALVLTKDRGSVGVCDAHLHILSDFSVGDEAPPFITKTKGHLLKK